MYKLVGKFYIGILLVIFGGIVLHAPFSVGFGTMCPQYCLLIKSWKEFLLLFAGLIALFLMYKTKQFKILRDPIIVAIGAYAMLHLILLFYMSQGLFASLAGLIINLRYLLFFGLVYIAMRLYPEYRKFFIRAGIAGALVVMIFALLQVFILPHDILKYIGYNVDTINPYLTIDKNHDFIRINSTLRGPNPLGSYAGIVLTLILAAIAKHKIKKEKWPLIITAILSVGGVVALWASYSRSAMIGTLIALAIILMTALYRKFSKKIWIITGLLLIILIGGLYMARNTQFVSNVIFHDNPISGSNVDSNASHITSLGDGIKQMIRQPLGAGIGSTGSASIIGGQPDIIENQYLVIANEVGWLGLGLFIFIFGFILSKLWELRSDWLALGVFASGVGLAVIGLFLPVWTDDTIAIIWWGLAAIALIPTDKGL